MHPVFRTRTALLAYCAAWILLGLDYRFLLAAAARLSLRESMAVSGALTLLLALLCLTSWYACKLLPLETRSLWKPILGQLVIATSASGIATDSLSGIVAGMGSTFHGIRQRFTPAIPVVAILISLTYLLAAALYYVVLAIESSRQAELLYREAQLKALKAQINPHFLFNSLNSISALTTADPSRARDMCIRLSDFLRTSLRLGERGTVPFLEELVLTRTYLDVERIRFGDRLRVKQSFDRECEDCQVPSLLVQPLIENAIKHGIATLIEGGEIDISGGRSRNLMRFVIENPFDPDAPAPERNGFGLINVRNRLEARYGRDAALEIQVHQNRYRVTVTLPYQTAREGKA